MFRGAFKWHKKASKKTPEDNVVSDHGLRRSQYPGMLAILTDKAYQGAQDDLRVLLPEKKRPHRMLSVDEEQGNSDLSSDTVIVDNYFGRSAMLWEVVSLKYRCSESMYDTIFRICMGVTNIHYSWHPLRDVDGQDY